MNNDAITLFGVTKTGTQTSSLGHCRAGLPKTQWGLGVAGRVCGMRRHAGVWLPPSSGAPPHFCVQRPSWNRQNQLARMCRFRCAQWLATELRTRSNRNRLANRIAMGPSANREHTITRTAVAPNTPFHHEIDSLHASVFSFYNFDVD